MKFNLMKSNPVQDNQLDPPPAQIDTTTGKCMWEIDGYKIWADDYQQALALLQIIEKF